MGQKRHDFQSTERYTTSKKIKQIAIMYVNNRYNICETSSAKEYTHMTCLTGKIQLSFK